MYEIVLAAIENLKRNPPDAQMTKVKILRIFT
jgi:hypothetical protein